MVVHAGHPGAPPLTAADTSRQSLVLGLAPNASRALPAPIRTLGRPGLSLLLDVAHELTGVRRSATAAALGITHPIVSRWCDTGDDRLPSLAHLALFPRAVLRILATWLFALSIDPIRLVEGPELWLQLTIEAMRIADAERAGDDEAAERAQQVLEETLAALRIQRLARQGVVTP
jgi:hypothetical protein